MDWLTNLLEAFEKLLILLRSDPAAPAWLMVCLISYFFWKSQKNAKESAERKAETQQTIVSILQAVNVLRNELAIVQAVANEKNNTFLENHASHKRALDDLKAKSEALTLEMHDVKTDMHYLKDRVKNGHIQN